AFLEKPILSAGNAKALAAVLAVAVILILPLPSFDGDGAGYTVLEERITPYQTLKVVDWGAVSSLYSDNTTHGGMRKADGRPAVAYVTHAASALLLRPDMKSVLLLGMGSGSVGTYLRSQKPNLKVEFAEIDPVVVELAREYFGIDSPEEDIHVVDARQMLVRAEGRRWDYIFVDTYIGHSIPFHLTTVEFFREVKKRLGPRGVLGLNLLARFDQPLPRSILRTVREVFPSVYLFDVTGGDAVLLLATNDPVPADPEGWAELGRELDSSYRFRPSLERLADTYFEGPTELEDALILSDRFAPVNHLLHLGERPEMNLFTEAGPHAEPAAGTAVGAGAGTDPGPGGSGGEP
ncbi:MAG: fused MFS/spermidine synthase, partial [Holophagales bacterium]|nr:fused MFS/spermidine synthase [Holophagales bacterium]